MNDYDLSGDVLGDVLGEDAELDGDMAVVGARGRRGAMLRVPPRPAWRRQIAPGVAMPGQGLEPLPLVPDAGAGIFTPALSSITWTATPQRPFRAERLICRVARSSGAGGVVVLAQAILIGAQLAQVDAGAIDLEAFAPTAFGVRLNLPPTTPGMRIVLPCNAAPAVPAGETVAVTLTLLGRVIR